MKTANRNRRLPLALLIIGITISGFTMSMVENHIEGKNTLRFQTVSSNIIDQLSHSVDLMQYGLGGAHGVFAASNSVTSPEFKDYVSSRDLDREFPGAMGFGFIEYVQRKDLSEFLKTNQSSEFPKFEIKTSGNADDLFIIKFIEPISNNHLAYGLDIGSESRRREAAELAMMSGLPTITKKIQLVQDSKKQAGFLYLKPVYKKGYSINTPEERTQAIYGWVYCPITLEKTLRKVIERHGTFFNIAVSEKGHNGVNELLYKSNGFKFQNLDYPIANYDIEVGQQIWSIAISPTGGFFTENSDKYLPSVVLALGVLTTIIISFGVLWALRGKEVQFGQRIQESEDFIKGIIDSANFSIIVTNPDGIIRVFNTTAEKWLGYPYEEIVNKVTPSLFHISSEVEKRAEELTIELERKVEPGFDTLIAKSRLGMSNEYDWTYKRKDGSTFPVQLSVTAVKNYRDEIIAYVGIGDDITEKQLAENKIKESELRFKSSFSHASHGIALVGMQGE